MQSLTKEKTNAKRKKFSAFYELQEKSELTDKLAKIDIRHNAGHKNAQGISQDSHGLFCLVADSPRSATYKKTDFLLL